MGHYHHPLTKKKSPFFYLERLRIQNKETVTRAHPSSYLLARWCRCGESDLRTAASWMKTDTAPFPFEPTHTRRASAPAPYWLSWLLPFPSDAGILDSGVVPDTTCFNRLPTWPAHVLLFLFLTCFLFQSWRKRSKNIQKVPLQPVCSATSAQSRLCHQWYFTAGSRPLLKLDYQPNDTGPTLDEEAKHV